MILKFTYIQQNHVFYSLFISSIYDNLLHSVLCPPEWPDPFQSGYSQMGFIKDQDIKAVTSTELEHQDTGWGTQYEW